MNGGTMAIVTAGLSMSDKMKRENVSSVITGADPQFTIFLQPGGNSSGLFLVLTLDEKLV